MPPVLARAGLAAADQRDGRFAGTRNRTFGEVDHSLQNAAACPGHRRSAATLTQRTGQIKRSARHIRSTSPANTRYVLTYNNWRRATNPHSRLIEKLPPQLPRSAGELCRAVNGLAREECAMQVTVGTQSPTAAASNYQYLHRQWRGRTRPTVPYLFIGMSGSFAGRFSDPWDGSVR